MRVKKTSDGYTTYFYQRRQGTSNSENLTLEIKKCDKTIKDYSEYLDYWKWNYEKAKKEYESRVKKIENAKSFKRLLEDHLNKIKSGEEPDQTYEEYLNSSRSSGDSN